MHVFIQLAPLVLVSGGILACAFIFLTMKTELHSLKRVLQLNQAHAEEFKHTLTTELEAVKIRLDEAEDRTGVLVRPTPPPSGFNLSKRSQAMRMSRHGEHPENIAAALSLPRREVELLLKVQKIVLSSAGKVTF